MIENSRSFWIALIATAALSASDSAVALSYVMPSDEALVDQAGGAALVTVEGRVPGVSGDMETSYIVRVERELGRGYAHGLERLVLPGSRVESGVGFWAVGVPTLHSGDRLLVLYQRRTDGSWAPEQLVLGMFFRIETATGAVYQRVLDERGNVAKGSNAEYARTRDPDRFERWVAARSRGIGARADYFLETHPERNSLKFNQTTEDSDGLKVRWFKFDSDQNEVWQARSDGQANTSQDEFAEFQQALAAWTNDAGSKILYTYGGTTATADTTCSSPSVITWNDPLGQIGGSYNCASGGTLGIGGPCYFLSTQTYAGQQEHPIFEGRVLVQDNAGCFMDGHAGADGAEFLTHEVGHSLGLDHSCEFGVDCVGGSLADAAIMRSRAHGDGRGAALGIDDRAAAAAIYAPPVGLDTIFADGFE